MLFDMIRSDSKWYIELDRFVHHLRGEEKETIIRQDLKAASAWRDQVDIDRHEDDKYKDDKHTDDKH